MNVKKSIGFTLLEIIIAMLILSMVTAGIFGLFVTSSKYIAEAGHRLQAVNYARMVAENLKIFVTADPGTNLTSGTPRGASIVFPSVTPATIDTGVTTLPYPFTLLPTITDTITNVGTPAPTCTYTVQNLAGGLKSATITVTWNEQ